MGSVVSADARTVAESRISLGQRQFAGAVRSMSARILSASIEELRAIIEDEARNNPVIDLDAFDGAAPPSVASCDPSPFSRPGRTLASSQHDQDHKLGLSHRRASVDAASGWQLLRSLPAPSSLYDRLSAQLPDVCVGEERRVRQFAEFLIAHLDRRGYFAKDAELLRTAFNENLARVDKNYSMPQARRAQFLSIDQANRAVQCLLQLEPIGVVARDLSGRLRAQARSLPVSVLSASIRKILIDCVSHHLQHFLDNRLDLIAGATRYSLGDLTTAHSRLRHLNPDPLGDSLRTEPAAPVVPDIVVELGAEDEVLVRVNQSALPAISVRNAYIELLENTDDPAIAQFVHAGVLHHQQLMHAIRMRGNTLRQVAGALVAKQRLFFLCGSSELRPLTQCQLGRLLGLHSSTISRAVNGKWIEFPSGYIEMQRLFATAQDITSLRVQQQVKGIVETEDKTRPLSDVQLQQMLARRGHVVARTTVVNYRHALCIPQARLRRIFA